MKPDSLTIGSEQAVSDAERWYYDYWPKTGVPIKCRHWEIIPINTSVHNEDTAKRICDAHNASLIPPRWIKTSERAPTEKDANQYGNVFTITGLTGWKFVIVRKLEYWMPIPPLPERTQDARKVEASNRDDVLYALQMALKAVESLPEDSLDYGYSPDGESRWPYRNELASHLNRAISVRSMEASCAAQPALTPSPQIPVPPVRAQSDETIAREAVEFINAKVILLDRYTSETVHQAILSAIATAKGVDTSTKIGVVQSTPPVPTAPS